MDTNEQTYPDDDLMESFVLGILPPDEQAELERQMALNPAIAEKVALHSKVVKTMRLARKAQLRKQFLTAYDKRERTEPTSPSGNRTLRMASWSAAALLLILFGTITYWLGVQSGLKQAVVVPPDTVYIPEPAQKTPLPAIQVDPRRQIAALIRRPTSLDPKIEKGNEHRDAQAKPSDTLGLMKQSWDLKKYQDVVSLGEVYCWSNPSLIGWELYADAAFKIRDFDRAESAYLQLDNYNSWQEAKWNLLVCYAFRYQIRKKEFAKLAQEIESWDKPNIFEKDLPKLKKLVR